MAERLQRTYIFTYILDVYHKYGAYIIEVESLYNSDLTYPNVPIYEDFDAYIYPEEETFFGLF